MNKNDKKIFTPTIKNLDKYDVFFVDDYKNPQYFNVQIDFDSLTYGKNYIRLGLVNNSKSPYTNKLSSEVQIEVTDIYGNVIFHELIDTPTIDYWAAFYIRLDEKLYDQIFSNETLDDGRDSIIVTILGELTDNHKKIPDKWVGVYNTKMVIPLSVSKNITNISNLYFYSTLGQSINSLFSLFNYMDAF